MSSTERLLPEPLSSARATAPERGIAAFALLFLMETLVRATIITVLPLQAYAILKSASAVSFLYSAIGFVGLISSLVIPLLIQQFARRWVYTLGGVCFVLLGFAVTTGTELGLAIGLAARTFGTGCMMITVQLYVLDYIKKHDFVRNDALRMTVSTVGWTFAPLLGVWLAAHVSPEAPFLLSSGLALCLIALFWVLRLSDNRVIRKAKTPPPNPLMSFYRFFRQPRLRLAWLIAVGRSTFWAAFFVFGPILMVKTGQSSIAGAILIGLGNVLLLTAWHWGKLGAFVGIRLTTTICFTGMTVSLVAAGLTGTAMPLVTAGILLVTAFFASGLDAIGGVPFYRAVRPLERPQMASVYRTYLDASDLIPPMIYGLLLTRYDLGVVFLALSVFQALCAGLSWRYLPKGL